MGYLFKISPITDYAYSKKISLKFKVLLCFIDRRYLFDILSTFFWKHIKYKSVILLIFLTIHEIQP